MFTSEQEQNTFLAHHGITKEQFEQSGISWDDLDLIVADHVKNIPDLQLAGNQIAERLRADKSIHSVRVRVKDSGHLAAKVIRKRLDGRDITLETYQKEITDLIGVRAIHLYKEQWPGIDDLICGLWKPKEKTANIRPGDPEGWCLIYKSRKCKIKERDEKQGCYRSVHYIVHHKPTLKDYHPVEIQVRTLFEEAWGEIDHLVNYPQKADDELLRQYLTILNRLAGLGDELGSFAFGLHKTLRESAVRIAEHEDEITRIQTESEEKHRNLQEKIEALLQRSKASETERAEIEKQLAGIKQTREQYEAVVNFTKCIHNQSTIRLFDPSVGMQLKNLQGSSFATPIVAGVIANELKRRQKISKDSDTHEDNNE